MRSPLWPVSGGKKERKKSQDMAQVNLLPKVRRKLKKTKTRKANWDFRPTF